MINLEDLLEAGESITVTATGNSMRPTFRNKVDRICICPCDGSDLKVGDVVFFNRGDQYCVHRIIRIYGDNLVIRGDGNSHKAYEKARRSDVVGIVTSGTMYGGREFTVSDPIWTNNTRKVLKYHWLIALWHRFTAILKQYPLSIIVVLALFYLSFFKPSDQIASVMGKADKLVHLVMYLGCSMVFWLEWMLAHKGRLKGRTLLKGFIYCFFFPIILGGLIELGQEYLTQYRGGDIMDFVANVCGSLIATVLSLLITYPVLKQIYSNEARLK